MQELKKKRLTQARLKELLKYNQETGICVWKQDRGGTARYGSIAGGIKKTGYYYIGIDGKEYLLHRLAWLFVHGFCSENDLDHINRNPLDNRIENLREVTAQCNMRNTGNPIINTSGVKGVSWIKDRNKWYVNIAINQKTINLGRYKDFAEAVCHRLAAEQCLNWSTCDSSSPAYKYVQKMLCR